MVFTWIKPNPRYTERINSKEIVQCYSRFLIERKLVSTSKSVQAQKNKKVSENLYDLSTFQILAPLRGQTN